MNESEEMPESSKKFNTFQKKKNVTKSLYEGRMKQDFRGLLIFFVRKNHESFNLFNHVDGGGLLRSGGDWYAGKK